MNLGPGHMDIGSNGFSPLSFAMSNPSMASMSPFIPRSTPPPPIRIQLQDSLAEHFKSNFLTPSERAVSEKDVSFLKENINHEMSILQTELESAKTNLSSYVKRIGGKLKELRVHRDAIKKETFLMKNEIEEEIKKTNDKNEII